MFKVTYTKHFTGGSLKGLHYDASVNFASEATAKDWLDAMKHSSKATSRYKNFPFTTSNFRLANIS